MTPFLSCVMPTRRARRWSVTLAMRCFLAQEDADGVATELVIVDDEDAGTYDLVEDVVHDLCDDAAPEVADAIISKIRYVALPGKPLNAGEKWAAAIECAEGDWVALWSDDDWHAPDRVKHTLNAIKRGQNVDIVGDRRMLIHELVHPRRTFAFAYPEPSDPPVFGETAYFAGGTLAIRKSFATAHPMPGLARGCDTQFCLDAIWEHGARWRYIDEAYLTVAMRHHENTGNTSTPTGDCFWTPWQGDLARLTGGMVDRFVINWARRDKI
jgi:glycosyltransferase involved in cell wall biosynthesis